MAENESKKDMKAEEASSGGKPSPAKAGKSTGPNGPISDKQRFHYIGFEVFPGKPRDLFKSDQDKKNWVERVIAKRGKGKISRENNTLMEQRVSMGERILMAVASLFLLLSLFVPWYSAYTIVEAPATSAEQVSVPADSLNALPAESGLDTAAIAGEAEPAVPDTVMAATTEGAEDTSALSQTPATSEIGSEEIITAQIARKKVTREYATITWLGSIASFGSVSGHVFSSGGILIISGALMLIFMLLAVLLPFFNLYMLFGTGKQGDDLAVYLKRMLRINWLPLIILMTTLVLSFFGADYGFDAESVFDSLNDSYSIGAFFNTVSWGPFVVLAASMLVAVKGAEI